MSEQSRSNLTKNCDPQYEPLWPFAQDGLGPKDAEVMKAIEDVLDAVERCSMSRRRNWVLPYLATVYRRYCRWKRRGMEGKMGRRIARLYLMSGRRSIHPAKRLIDATAADVDRRQRSRWGRALIHAEENAVAPKQLKAFFDRVGGISGAARKQANPRSNSRSSVDDWAP